jgi:hypothetical protein
MSAGCPTALEQGGYTWRHNVVLKTIHDSIQNHLTHKNEWVLSIDLDNKTPTLNPKIFGLQPFRPDLVLLSPTHRRALILELTCPLPHNLDKWHNIKSQKYLPCAHAARLRGWHTEIYTIEVACAGSDSQGITKPLTILGIPNDAAENTRLRCQHIAAVCTKHIISNAHYLSWTELSLEMGGIRFT